MTQRGFYARTDTPKRELINMMLEVIATEQISQRGSPMSVDNTFGG